MTQHDHRGDVEQHRCAACVEAWREATTVEELGVLGARWLTGELELQPRYYGAGPDPETLLIVPALVAVNRAGLWTDQSQPGDTTPGCEQRAYVSGFCSAELADRLVDLGAGTDLVVLVCPADTPGPFAIPITIDDGQPFTFAGAGGEHPDDFASELGPEAVAALWEATHVEVLDPHWGRNDLLWDALVRAIVD